MKFQYRFLGHATGLVTDGQEAILIDPFYSGEFYWSGKTEVMLDKMREEKEKIEKIAAIFITHEHGDHCDIETLRYLVNRDNSIIYAPYTAYKILRAESFKDNVKLIDMDQVFNIGDMEICSVGNYDSGVDEENRCLKLSFHIKCNDKTLIHLGDCHNPENINDKYTNVDYCMAWTSTDDVEKIIDKFKPVNFMIFHYDKYTPGDFWCNKDPFEAKIYLNKKYKDMNVIVPEGIDRIIEIK